MKMLGLPGIDGPKYSFRPEVGDGLTGCILSFFREERWPHTSTVKAVISNFTEFLFTVHVVHR